MKWMTFVFFMCLSSVLYASDSLLIRTYGIRINVTDMDKALDFYGNKLGFEVDSKENYPQQVWLKTNSANKFLLHKVNNLVAERPQDTRAGLTLQVNNLDETIKKLKEKGVDFGDNIKRKEGVGYCISFSDPFGTKLHLMQVTVVQAAEFKEPKIYNYGFLLPDMDQARKFFCEKLSFIELSQKYLPLDMPLGHKNKSFAFMLHYREGVEPIHYNTTNDEHIVILFQTHDLETAVKKLKSEGVQLIQKKPLKAAWGTYVSFRDPAGYVSELIETQQNIAAENK